MRKLIIVCGLPASGKSTLAENLSKKLNIVCLHKDSIIDRLSIINQIQNFEDYKKISRISLQLFFMLAEEQLQNGVDLIIQSTLNFEENVTMLNKWRDTYNLNCYSVVCQIDEKIRQERFINRLEHYKKYFIHEKINTNNTGSFSDDQLSFDYTKMPGKKIFVTTDKPTDVLVKEVIEQID